MTIRALSPVAVFVAAALATCPAHAQTEARLTVYGYGQGEGTGSGPVIDLRGRLTPAPKPAVKPPADLVPAAPPPSAFTVSAAPETPLGADGVAGWYEREGLTASGETFDASGLMAASPTMPLASLALVTNLENNKEVIVRVNDRAPAFQDDKLIVVSPLAADELGFRDRGEARVRVRYLGPAPSFITSARPPGVIAPTPATQPPAPAFASAAFETGPMRGEGTFAVQIGAYGDPANAERARQAAQDAGPVSIEQAFTGGRPIYRVRLGPWEDRDDAERARKKAARLGFSDARVTTR